MSNKLTLIIGGPLSPYRRQQLITEISLAVSKETDDEGYSMNELDEAEWEIDE